jgi:hypothetical protein
MMTTILHKILTKLPDGVTLLTSANTSSVLLYYTLVQDHAPATHNKIGIFVDIPLKFGERFFELYCAHKLPATNEPHISFS